jgi:uncharacterized protein
LGVTLTLASVLDIVPMWEPMGELALRPFLRPEPPPTKDTWPTTKDWSYAGFWKLVLDYDPMPALRALRCPALFIYGGLYQVVRADVNAPLAKTALDSARTDFDVSVYPRSDHLMREASTGDRGKDRATTRRFVPGYLDTVTEWVLRRVTVKD